MTQMRPEEIIVVDTVVHLIRKVRWGATRDQLEAKAAEFTERCRLAEMASKDFLSYSRKSGVSASAWREHSEKHTASVRNTNGLRWSAYLHRLAAECRFERDGDKLLSSLREEILDHLRWVKAGKPNTSRTPSHPDIQFGASESLKTRGLRLNDISLPPTLMEMVERGMERPQEVSQERWDDAVSLFYRRMDSENSWDDLDDDRADMVSERNVKDRYRMS